MKVVDSSGGPSSAGTCVNLKDEPSFRSRLYLEDGKSTAYRVGRGIASDVDDTDVVRSCFVVSLDARNGWDRVPVVLGEGAEFVGLRWRGGDERNPRRMVSGRRRDL